MFKKICDWLEIGKIGTFGIKLAEAQQEYENETESYLKEIEKMGKLELLRSIAKYTYLKYRG